MLHSGNCVPRVRNNYVVEWCMLLAEAGEADPDDHLAGEDSGADLITGRTWW